jgi:dethiobiotin synthetase
VALAPPMAARRLGQRPPQLAELVAELAWPNPSVAIGLVETVGGLRSPQTADGDALDLAGTLAPDLVLLVGDAGLGTISHVRLAAEALCRAGLAFVVVLNRYDSADVLHTENLQWLRQRDGLEVLPGDAEAISQLATRLSTDDPGGDDRTPS